MQVAQSDSAATYQDLNELVAYLRATNPTVQRYRTMWECNTGAVDAVPVLPSSVLGPNVAATQASGEYTDAMHKQPPSQPRLP